MTFSRDPEVFILPPSLEAGLRCMLDGAWFEAHELIEEVWRPTDGDERRFLQGLIQAAVSLVHLQRGNPRGALGQWTKAQGKWRGMEPWRDGVGIGPWQESLSVFFSQIRLEERVARYRAGESDGDLPPLPPPESWPRPPLTAELALRVDALPGVVGKDG
ncbi:MAG: DUF309 domain-containing protein [Myxococcota bacterium]|jgi:hypothetical protein|nr:DUF309 domain-containing protein [Myxococcota bacterium]